MSKNRKSFLLISDKSNEYWYDVLKDAISDLGNIRYENYSNLPSDHNFEVYDLVIVNLKDFEESIQFTSNLLLEFPNSKIVIALGIPTWRRVRKIFLNGASDYLVTSLDREKLRGQINTIFTNLALMKGAK